MGQVISLGELLARLLLALAFSGVVGLQREIVGKAAGMRTHILVGVGSAVFTLATGAIYQPAAPDTNRAAAQLITGIGFIGGGAILKEGGSVKGLTSAAGLWAVAALGMAAGMGFHTLALAATIIVLITLVIFRTLERRLHLRMREHWTLALALPAAHPIGALEQALAAHSRAFVLIGLTSAETSTYTYQIELTRPDLLGPLTTQLKAAGAQQISWRAAGNIEER